MGKKGLKYELYLIRHAETWDNLGIYPEGSTLFERCNSYLSDKGKRQASLVGERFAKLKVDHIFASPLIRTVFTAGEIIDRQPEGGAGEVEILPKLIECGFPDVDVSYDVSHIKSMTGAGFDIKMAKGVPGGKNICCPTQGNSDAEDFERARDVVRYIDGRFSGGEKIVLVSHYGAGTNLLPAFLRLPASLFAVPFYNASVSKIKIYDETHTKEPVYLEYVNDASHLYEEFPEYRRV